MVWPKAIVHQREIIKLVFPCASYEASSHVSHPEWPGYEMVLISDRKPIQQASNNGDKQQCTVMLTFCGVEIYSAVLYFRNLVEPSLALTVLQPWLEIHRQQPLQQHIAVEGVPGPSPTRASIRNPNIPNQYEAVPRSPKW